MKIKNGLNQFKDENVILAVAGERKAVFYVAGDGEINKVGAIEELVPKYEDNEGFFGGKKGGSKGRMGNPEPVVRKEYLQNKFASKFDEEIKALEGVNNSSPIYLFAPSSTNSLLTKSLPKATAKRIKMDIVGNYLHAKPFELIAMIEAKSVSGKTVIKEKARKLLK